MSLSVSPHNSKILQGGTQDNGTWQTNGNPNMWENMMIGDGGQSGFDVAVPEHAVPHVHRTERRRQLQQRQHRRLDLDRRPDVRRCDGVSEFYSPVISDPMVSGTMFAGTGVTAYRTKTFGLGSRTIAEANAICNEWTGTFAENCGDWARARSDTVDSPRPSVTAPAAPWLRSNGRRADTSTAWAATDQRSRLHLEERGRGSGRVGVLDQARRRLSDRSQPVRQQHLCRPGQRQPRLDLLQRIRREHTDHARTHLRGHVRPGHRYLDVGGSFATTSAISPSPISSSTT